MNIELIDGSYIFHPGYYVNELIEEMGVTQEGFALYVGVSPEIISLLVRGEVGLTEDVVLKLSNSFGMSAEVWLNLQKKYDESVLTKESL